MQVLFSSSRIRDRVRSLCFVKIATKTNQNAGILSAYRGMAKNSTAPAMTRAGRLMTFLSVLEVADGRSDSCVTGVPGLRSCFSICACVQSPCV